VVPVLGRAAWTYRDWGDARLRRRVKRASVRTSDGLPRAFPRARGRNALTLGMLPLANQLARHAARALPTQETS
jgi:hypothetical protein